MQQLPYRLKRVAVNSLQPELPFATIHFGLMFFFRHMPGKENAAVMHFCCNMSAELDRHISGNRPGQDLF